MEGAKSCRRPAAEELFSELHNLDAVVDSLVSCGTSVFDLILGPPPPLDLAERSARRSDGTVVENMGVGLLGNIQAKIRRNVLALTWINERMNQLAAEINTGQPAPPTLTRERR